jgi:phosphate transport system substrate-binding protein
MSKLTSLLAAALAAAVLAAVASAAPAQRSAVTLSGAGSTLVQPLVNAWVDPLGHAFDYQLQYSGVGSGAGVAAITNRSVDFGASDAPLSKDQFTACKSCEQIPWALSATSVIYNMPSLKNNLHMSGPVLAKIFEGVITKWSDPEIQALNKGVSLPDTSISVVHRSDNSGTSYNFTQYLSAVSAPWHRDYGWGVSVNWPAGTGAQGSSGVSATVGQTAGAIGYVDVAYALHNHLQFFAVQNAAGKFELPNLRDIKTAALSDAKPAKDNSLTIVNPPKKFKTAYPISTFTYAIVPLKSSKAAPMKKFLTWAVTKGQSYATDLIFQPLPSSVLKVDMAAIKKIH